MTALSIRWISRLAILVGIIGSPAQAQNVPDYVREEIAGSQMIGKGSYRWFGLKVYDACLWSSPSVFQRSDPMASKFVLELRYAREFKGVEIADRSIVEMRKLNFGTVAQQAEWLRRMRSVFPDVSRGTRLGGVYIPDLGARFYLDGRFLEEIPDPEFARAFFAIWLDARTGDSGLRDNLLGTET